MKFRASTYIIAIALFAMLAIPLRLAAQGQKEAKGHHRYKLVDIGTFGGPASYINFPSGQNGFPAINSTGTAVGSSATPIPTTSTSNGYSCQGLNGTVPFVFHGFEWQDGVVTDLGSLPGPTTATTPSRSMRKGRSQVYQKTVYTIL